MVDPVGSRSPTLPAPTSAKAKATTQPAASSTTPAQSPARQDGWRPKDGVARRAPSAQSSAAAAPSASASTQAPRAVALVGAERAKAPQVGLALKNPAGELGYLGPVGPSGPLGEAGPVGNSAWNPSHYISGSMDWSSLSKLFTVWGGPLSRFGPLGERGPLSQASQASLAPELKVGGSKAVLGPSGPLGALGPLGPLGPTGAHGHQANQAGDYVDAQGKPVRTIEVDWSLQRRSTEELVESYSEARAKRIADNDTSFMVSGTAKKAGESDRYSFHSRTDQYVTVLVLPTQGAAVGSSAGSSSIADFAKNFDDFDLKVTDETGKVLGSSSLKNGSDWVQLKVPKGAELRAEVTLKGSPHAGPKPYRLVVVGTGDHTGELKPWQ